MALRLPAGWTVRPTDSSELEILDANGVSEGRTGTHALIGAYSGDGDIRPYVVDGALWVCPW